MSMNNTPAYMGGASGGGGGIDIPGWLNSLFGGKKNDGSQDQGGGFGGVGNPAPAQYTTPAYMSGATGAGSADVAAIQPSGGGFGGGVSGTFDPSPTSAVAPVPHDDITGASTQQQNPMIAGILAAINDKTPYSSGPYMQNLDAARAASLKAIAGARDTTNSDYTKSDQKIGDIYAKGKQDTLADNQVLKDNNANLVGGLNTMYAGATKGLQDDRTKEMQDTAAMDSALGIQQAGLGTAGQTQTKAIANASQAQQASVDKALQYGGADLTENTARADGLISEGSARRDALRNQLGQVLNGLTSKELDVNQQYDQNAMQARNQSYQDNLSKMSALYGMYDKELTRSDNRYKTDQNSRVTAAAIAAMGKQGGSGSSGGLTNIQDANNFVQTQGGNPGDYNNAYTDAILNAGTPAGQQPTETDILKAMHNKNPGLDLTQALSYIRNAANSSKYNTPNTGISQMLGQYMGGQ